MKITKLDKALQIIAALYNLPELPTEGINYNRAVKLARRPSAELEERYRLANKILLERSHQGA